MKKFHILRRKLALLTETFEKVSGKIWPFSKTLRNKLDMTPWIVGGKMEGTVWGDARNGE